MVFVQVWPQLSFPDSHKLGDFPSILLEYGLGHDRHKILMVGFLRPRLFFPHAPVLLELLEDGRE